MPDVKITVGQTEAMYFYRLVFPDGLSLTVAVSPLNNDVAGRVVGAYTDEYSMIIPIDPRGRPWFFLRPFAPGAAYVQQQMELPPWAASLVASIMVKLAAAAPADDIAAAAESWWKGA